jgi:hypothetical protein
VWLRVTICGLFSRSVPREGSGRVSCWIIVLWESLEEANEVNGVDKGGGRGSEGWRSEIGEGGTVPLLRVVGRLGKRNRADEMGKSEGRGKGLI